jgi:hypothetical protein
MRTSLLLTSLFSLLPLLVHAQPSNQWGQGPISFSNPYIFSSLHSSVRAESPKLLDEGEYRLRSGYLWANTAVIEDYYTTDVETRNIPFEIGFGFSESLEIGVSTSYNWRGGGRLDNFIDGWHRFFSLPRGDRRRLEDNSYFVEGLNQDGSSYALEEQSWGLGNTELTAKIKMSDGAGADPALSLLLTMGLPTAKTGFGHSGIDLSASLLASRRYNKTILYLGGGPLWFSDTNINNVAFHPLHFEGFASLEYEWAPSFSFISTLLGGTQAVDDIRGHPDHFLYLDLGVALRTDQNWKVEALLRENPSPGEATTDIVFGLFVTYES